MALPIKTITRNKLINAIGNGIWAANKYITDEEKRLLHEFGETADEVVVGKFVCEDGKKCPISAVGIYHPDEDDDNDLPERVDAMIGKFYGAFDSSFPTHESFLAQVVDVDYD